MKAPELSLKAIDEWLSTIPPETLFKQRSTVKCAVAAYLNATHGSKNGWHVRSRQCSDMSSSDEPLRTPSEVNHFIVVFDDQDKIQCSDVAWQNKGRETYRSAQRARDIIKMILDAKIKKTPHSSE